MICGGGCPWRQSFAGSRHCVRARQRWPRRRRSPTEIAIASALHSQAGHALVANAASSGLRSGASSDSTIGMRHGTRLSKEFLIVRAVRGVHGARPLAAEEGEITLIPQTWPPSLFRLARRREFRGRIAPASLPGAEKMAKDPFEQFAIPTEMRAFAEQSVAQARKAFEALSRRPTRPLGRCKGAPRRRTAAPAKSPKNRWHMPRRM